MLFEPPIDLSPKPPLNPQYMIMCRARTGSTLLSYALGCHSELMGDGEIFNEGDFTKVNPMKAIFKLKTSEALQIKSQTRVDMRKYLDHFHGRLNGFKLLYGQWDEIPYLFDHLKDTRPHIKIIYLERNVSHSVVSDWMARTRGLFHKYQAEDVPYPDAVNIPLDHVDWYFEKFANRQPFYRNQLSGLDSIEIHYEDLIRQWDEACYQIESFLRIKSELLPKITKKVLPEPENYVINYNEVRERCDSLMRELYSPKLPESSGVKTD